MPPLFVLAMAPNVAPAAQPLNPIQQALGPLAGSPMVPILLMIGVLYLVLFRPQQKQMREQEAAQKRVATGDEIITTGGLVGKVTHATDDVLTVEVHDKVRVRVLRTHVNPRPKPKAAASDKADDKSDKVADKSDKPADKAGKNKAS